MMFRSVWKLSVLAVLLGSAAGCMGGPRQRPVKGGPVDEGPESITAARKFLEGRWALEEFQVFPPGKPAITLTGSGSLNYDRVRQPPHRDSRRREVGRYAQGRRRDMNCATA